MEPQTPPTSTTSDLDPGAVNLAKSIRQTESGGNFNAQGKSGEYGAYQFTQPTWNAASKSAGVNVPLQQASPEQQNEVAYKQIKTWKDQGHNVGQIASMWNAGQGEQNAYLGHFADGEPATGTNKEGVEYNVPAYAEKVANNYQSLKGPGVAEAASSPVPSNPSASGGQPGWLSALEGLGIGAAGWLVGQGANTLKQSLPAIGTGVGEFIEPLGGGIPGEAVGQGLANLIPGNNNQNQQTGGTQQPAQSQQTPNLQAEQGPQESALASDLVKNAINESMQGTQTNRVYSQSDPGQRGIQAASMFGLINPDEQGNLQYDEEKSQKLEGEIGQLLDKQIESQDKKISPLSVSNLAGNYIGSDRFSTNLDRQAAAKHVQENLTADNGGSANGQMSLSAMRKAQKEHYAAAKNKYNSGKTTAQILAHKALGNAYGQAIRENIGNKDLYDRTKKMQQGLINAREVGKRLKGKKAPQNKGAWESFLKHGARAAEIYIGERIGGPIGAIIGGYIGEGFNRKLEKKFGRNVFETKGIKAALDILQDTKPEIYTKIVDELKNQNINLNESDSPPTNQKAEIKDVQKDLKKMGKRGLIDIPKKKSRV